MTNSKGLPTLIRLKPGSFGYLWQTALALIGPIQDTLVESTIF